MTDEFLIGASTDAYPETWAKVETLLTSVSGDITLRAMMWEFQPYVEAVTLGNGQKRGMGLPIARWTFKNLRIEQRENLRDFCTGASNTVYIRTPTNETVSGVRTWDDFLAIMSWVERSEILSDGLNYAEMVEITFTHCVAV